MGWNIFRRLIAIGFLLSSIGTIGAQMIASQASEPWASPDTSKSQSGQLPAQFPSLMSPLDENLPKLDEQSMALVDQLLKTTRKDWLQSVFNTAHPFRYLIQARMALYRMPKVVYYVPFVESEFVVNAVSRSGAGGIWQFMPNSSLGYFTIEPWYDERFDFVKATDSGLRKLSQNYSVLRDWQLALAAYNAGLGAIQRGLAQVKEKSFLGLKNAGQIRRETQQYVPKILAFMWIGEQAGRLGMQVDWKPAVFWDALILDEVPTLSKLEQQFALFPGSLRLVNQSWRNEKNIANQTLRHPIYAQRQVLDHLLSKLKKSN